MFVNIKINSKNRNSLQQYLILLGTISNKSKLDLKFIFDSFMQQNKNKIYTILTSPHVNKSSQEQFEYNIKSKQLKITSFQLFKTLIVLKKIRKVCGFDVNIIIKYSLNYKSNRIFLINGLSEKKYKIKQYNNLFHISGYLKILDLKGETLMSSCLNSSVGRAKD